MNKFNTWLKDLSDQGKFLFWCAVFVFGLVFGYDFGAYLDCELHTIIQDVMIEIHGFLLDIVIVGLIFLVLEKKYENKVRKEKIEKRLTELATSSNPDYIAEKCSLIKELNQLNVLNHSLFNMILDGGNLKNIKIMGADLLYCGFNDTDLTYSELNGSHFSNCNFAEAKFYDAEINEKATFSGCIYGDTYFVRTKLKGAKFINEKLYKTYFQKAVLIDADFSEANLIHTNFHAADLTCTIFDDAFVPKDWFNRLEVWQSIGREQIIEKYYIVELQPNEYQLKKKSN